MYVPTACTSCITYTDKIQFKWLGDIMHACPAVLENEPVLLPHGHSTVLTNEWGSEPIYSIARIIISIADNT